MSLAEFRARTHAELLPTPELAEKWVSILTDLRQEADPTARERKFSFGHGWITGLVDAQVIGLPARDDLRELLIAARPR